MSRVVTIALTSLFALLLATPCSAAAESLSSLFDGANEAFGNGDYTAASAGYARLEELGVREPAVSYNLATAYARQGKLGLAVQHYERALRRDPGHEDSHHNLALVRDFIARRASEAGRDADLAPAVGPWRAREEEAAGPSRSAVRESFTSADLQARAAAADRALSSPPRRREEEAADRAGRFSWRRRRSRDGRWRTEQAEAVTARPSRSRGRRSALGEP